MTTSDLATEIRLLRITTKDTLTLDECAAYTGLARNTIINKTSSHTIPHYKQGKNPYFDRKEIDAWCKKNKVNTVEEIELKAINHRRSA